MTFISTKIINGQKRHYAEKSFRTPDGRVKKISEYIKSYDPKKDREYISKYDQILDQKARETMIKSLTGLYSNGIFDQTTIRRIEEAKDGYQKIRKKLTPTQMEDVIDRFTAHFTYESNAIEGNSLTLKDITFIFKENRAMAGKDLREIHESLNTREAMNRLFSDNLKLTENGIIELQSILVKNTGITPGYKKLPNFLMMRNVKTTPPEKVTEEMKKLLAWQKGTKNMHILEKAAVFHGRMEQIHPFEDGNGRTGRMIINAMLTQAGYPPLIIRKTQRGPYFSTLEAFDNKYQDKLKRFMIDRYLETYEKFFEVYVRYI